MKRTTAESASKVLAALREVARDDKAAFFPGFFQAVPGGYGEGDRFLGCVVPDLRKVARRFRELSRSELEKLFASAWHECRLTGMLILVDQFERAAKLSEPERQTRRAEHVAFYLANLGAVNNWDIVDATAPKLLGAWLVENPGERAILDRLAASDVLWERRVAVVATYSLIKNDQFAEIVRLSETLMTDSHDLMHKAMGWMLREMGKRDPTRLEQFLARNAKVMPRTMLRYAIEKMSKEDRAKWMMRE
ncbi:MAG: DNA alkylation repair protein [Pirellulaceae bacterium]